MNKNHFESIIEKRMKLVNLRKRLYEENPNCPECGCHMIMSEDVTTKTQPDNMCTIDHTYGRLHPEHGKKQQEFTIMCNKCNFLKGRDDEQAVGIEVLRERSSYGCRNNY